MNLSIVSDEDLMSDIEFAASVMATDSEIEDVQLEYMTGDVVTYTELLEEASRRAELKLRNDT
jgi:hypothetical protein